MEMFSNVEYKTSWLLLKKAFPVLNETHQLPFEDYIKEEEFQDIVRIVKTLDLIPIVQSLIINKIEKHLREQIAPKFWTHFVHTDDEYDGFRQFYKAVELLYDYFIQYSHVMVKLDLLRDANKHNDLIYNEISAINALKLIIRSIVLSQMPADRKIIIENFYTIALRSEDEESHLTDGLCKVCLRDTLECVCPHYFYETNRKLAELELLEPMVGQILTSLIYVYIEVHIQKVCKDSFDVSYIDSLEKWLDVVVLSWLKKIYCCDPQPNLSNTLNKFNKKLTNFLYETYCKILINHLFNIIIEYPESLPALEDLRLCLPKTDLRPLLTKKLQKAMETRLLHPGVGTTDILTAYIATIRSLRILDPSGLLMETITKPVHKYLRSREDTVRCVVNSLTEEGPNDLAEELARGDAVQMDDTVYCEEDTENWETWMPDPVGDSVDTLSNRRNSDIISMLVNVYGSKELFVNEYRTLLADRLLSQFTCDTEKEIRYLELLKLRFGDSQLHYCEVMLKDIQDSKRINQHIKNDPEYKEENFPVNSIILSAQFWPPFKEEKLELHPRLVDQLEAYTKAFETLKGNRTLCWKHHLGLVDLEIESSNKILNFSVSPILATILMHFQAKSEWTLDELSKIMQVPPTNLKRKIGYWQSHRIIAEIEPDVYCLLEEEEDKTKAQSSDIIVEDFESESAMASTQDQREEELQTFWSYIVGMLMNLDTLPLERIHQMLKMFAFQGPTIECSMQELKIFLDRKVREHQLIFSNGSYRLPKP